MRFVPLKGPMSVELVLEDPLPDDLVGSGWTWNEVPSVVLQQSTMFLFYSSPPGRISKCAAEGPGHRRQQDGVEERWNTEAALCTRRHGVLDGDRRHSHGALGQRRWCILTGAAGVHLGDGTRRRLPWDNQGCHTWLCGQR